MGLMNKFADSPLSSPKTSVVAVDERFVLNKPVTLLLKEKIFSLSGDDFTIKDTNDVSYFKCKGKAFNIKSKKNIYDINNKPLFNIQNKNIIALKKKMIIFSGENEANIIATICPKTAIFSKTSLVEFKNKLTGENEVLKMKYDLIGNSCGIFYGESENAPLICKIHRKFDAKLILTSKDNYHVDIAPGVDISLMLALGICFDEIKNDKLRKSNNS
ncbi:hypothetical protein BCR32DRAFT_328767 [Anaeromyces robustus]|uniref:DUF567-domain-containing protein n=1 Tax=Anaeromyces robustus TaxID=1754192 RepID=A0A1Y1WX82_9FUNG|nr:hypothetical protein BCR32DRAFT_328767 [Anaeromyces robustus]|eukprot:ORX77816.1 hypothetical protein BCR32DRAFT_328767 [Anaeromyces robustus]